MSASNRVNGAVGIDLSAVGYKDKIAKIVRAVIDNPEAMPTFVETMVFRGPPGRGISEDSVRARVIKSRWAMIAAIRGLGLSETADGAFTVEEGQSGTLPDGSREASIILRWTPKEAKPSLSLLTEPTP